LSGREVTSPRKAEPQPTAPRRSQARLPWWKKLLFGLLVTVLLFASLEGVLWLAGVQPIAATDDPYVGFAGNLPLFVERTDDQGRAMMVTAPGKLAWFNQEHFPRVKPPDVRRVFCLGGSTTYGRPYDHRTAFSAWLAELLPLAAPDRRWEVINAGGVSYASYRVTGVMRELARYGPDLFVVYTGHNEFLEERTYGPLRDKPAALLETAGLLSHTRTYSVLHRLLARDAKPRERKTMLPEEVDAALDHSVGPSAYQRDDAQRDAVLAHFRWNLQQMIAIARGCGAEIVFVVPASNLKDCSPFKSQHRAGLTDQELARFEQLFGQAKQQHDRFAELHFLRGRILLALDRPAEATRAFQRALEEDVCPLRAPAAFCRAVREVAAAHDVPVIDFELLVKNDCLARHGHNAPGEQYFLDHVHPTLDGHRLLATAIVETLREDGGVGELHPLTESDIAQAETRITQRIDPRDHAIALRNLAKVLNWAGKHEEAGRLAQQSLEVLPDDPESLLLAGAWLKSQGRIDEALDHLRRSVHGMPAYADARQLLGAVLVDAGRLDEAHEQFQTLVRLRPEDAHAWQMLGAIRAEEGRYEDSLEYYHKALSLAPDDANLRNNLGLALLELGRYAESEKHLRRAVELNARDAEAHYQLGRLLEATGRPDEAAEQFRTVLRLAPDHQPARDALSP
jgi:tetratricopeptide (TPR) repeat protein